MNTQFTDSVTLTVQLGKEDRGVIVVRVELWPFGSEENKKEFGLLKIVNDGTGTQSRGNYHFGLFGKTNRLMNKGEIKGWPRKQKHVWALIHRVLGEKYVQRKDSIR